ncbi:MAG: metal-dependent hydrolase [Planctomycetota bacterium]|nr:MAG: metal-dependent hydrolase [Planctomycetota bacterium]REJ97692.1 MAG: metal-dependent hydrolase [Planctomycetota bacterium]REK26693.1 MAG: metal-dependent hydrolase [Planctomycetota bacterium]REK35647.1 MAG: metal-dependent hydrolase [Planctomycetota bacterium]
MKLHFLGTGGYHPTERRHTACLMLPEIGVIFDAGTSFYRVEKLRQTDRVQIFLSHAHLDHIVGLTYILVPLLRGGLNHADVYGSAATIDAVRRHLFSPPMFPVLPDYRFHLLEEHADIPVPGDGVVTHQPLPSHPGGSTAFRLDFPSVGDVPARSLAYVTDTTVDGTYTEFIRRADLLIHECNFSDDEAEWCDRTGHSHTSQTAALARAAGVGRMILLHVDPQLDGDDPLDLAVARSVFPETELAEDGDVREF